jgi:addiction module HigA family antidote
MHHPGCIIKGASEDLALTVTDAARVLNVSRPALSRVINGRAGVSAEMVVRLAKAFGSNPEFWLRLQLNYEMAQVTKRADTIIVNPLPTPVPINQ